MLQLFNKISTLYSVLTSNKIGLPAGHMQVLKYLCACLSPVHSQEGEASLGQPELSPGWATDKKAAPP